MSLLMSNSAARRPRHVVETLIASVLGFGVLDEVGFTRLGGAGGARRADRSRRVIERLVTRARARKRQVPRLATSLQQLVAKTTAGKWHLRKPALDEHLALLIAEEMNDLPIEDWWRPLPTFVVDRIVPPLNRPLPAGRR